MEFLYYGRPGVRETVDKWGTTVVNREAKLTCFTLVIKMFLSSASPEFLLMKMMNPKSISLFFFTFR